MNNLDIYNKLKEVPQEAQKKITGGRLSGMTDIKPMWRIEKLTETFGMCGIGWYTETTRKEIIDGANDEKIAVVDIKLYVKVNGEWSQAIEGSGGSSFVAKERNGLYTSDECFKMAYTDALSVACKSLGMGANVYWGDSKYSTKQEATKQDAEEYIFKFGKYKDQKLTEVVKDEKYIDWILKNSKDEYLLKCIELLTGLLPIKEEDIDLDFTFEFQQLLVESGTDLEELLKYFKVTKPENLTKEQQKEAMEIMNKTIERNK